MRSWSPWRSRPDDENEHLPRVGDTVQTEMLTAYSAERKLGLWRAREEVKE